ncbi:MAG: hypothetical protein AAB690_02710 [Patescibacteria group bacterium]
MFKKQVLIFFIVFSLTSTAFYLPSSRTPRAHAVFGVLDTVINLPDIVWEVLDSVAIGIAQVMVDDMVRSTIDWANSGFEGSPAYNINPKAYFIDLADKAAGEVINNELQFLCSPFRDKIQLSLSLNYYQPPQEYFQCTFSEVLANVEDFYQGFNDGGGWDTWFEMTQNPTNNPYGAYIAAKTRLDTKINEESTRSKDELNQSSGYLNYRECKYYNPDESVLKTISDGLKSSDPVKRAYAKNYPEKYDLSKQAGACIEEGSVVTPGSAIKDVVEKSLGSGMARLADVESINELVGAFATGLLRRYVFAEGGRGLFSSGSSAESTIREVKDVDGDKIPDGYDYNDDGQLDICHHGLKDSEQSPSNDNCVGSRNASNSSFFIPICDKLASATKGTQKYLEFVEKNVFNKQYSNTWSNRTLVMSNVIENLTNTISRYEIEAYDPALFKLGKFTKYTDKVIESLAKDEDIRIGNNDDGLYDEVERQKIIKNTKELFQYLQQFQEVMGNCDNPDTGAIGSLPPPEIDDVGNEEGEEAGSPGSGSANQVSGSCYATTQEVALGEPVTWISQTNLQDATYSWSGDEISSRTAPTVSVTYSTAGGKSAGVSISGTDANGQSKNLSLSCLNSVTVTNEINQ